MSRANETDQKSSHRLAKAPTLRKMLAHGACMVLRVVAARVREGAVGAWTAARQQQPLDSSGVPLDSSGLPLDSSM